jgi:hypothetical protein
MHPRAVPGDNGRLLIHDWRIDGDRDSIPIWCCPIARAPAVKTAATVVKRAAVTAGKAVYKASGIQSIVSCVTNPTWHRA